MLFYVLKVKKKAFEWSGGRMGSGCQGQAQGQGQGVLYTNGGAGVGVCI